MPVFLYLLGYVVFLACIIFGRIQYIIYVLTLAGRKHSCCHQAIIRPHNSPNLPLRDILEKE